MTELRDTFDLEAMKAELIRDEGLVLHVYKDPGSGRAIGVGRNLDTQGLSVAELAAIHGEAVSVSPVRGDEAVGWVKDGIPKAAAMTLLVNDITDRAHQLDSYLPWWRLLSPVRQRVLLNMAFEMGTHGMILWWSAQRPGAGVATVEVGDFAQAAGLMERSAWGTGKTHNRAARLAEAMRRG